MVAKSRRSTLVDTLRSPGRHSPPCCRFVRFFRHFFALVFFIGANDNNYVFRTIFKKNMPETDWFPPEHEIPRDQYP